MTRNYRATPEEIGRLRLEIRDEYRRERDEGACLMNPIMKAATLDTHSWIWLLQRLRPAERRWICARTERGPTD